MDIHEFNPENGPHPDEDVGEPPTDRQLEYAEKLARQHDVVVPDRVYRSRGACGAFIGEWAKRR